METITDLTHPVGIQLGELRLQVAELAGLPVFGVPDAELPAVIAAVYGLVNQVQAVALSLVAQADAVEIARRRKRLCSTQAWLTHQQHLRPGQAKRDVLLARELQNRPEVAAGMAAGLITYQQAEEIIGAISELPSDAGQACRADVEKLMVDLAVGGDGQAGGQGYGPLDLRRAGLKIRDQHDPAAAEAAEAERLARQEEDAHRRRYLRLRADGYGSVYGSFRLSAVQAGALRAVLDVLAKPRPAADGAPDPRLAEQRLVDALIQLAKLVQLDGDLPAHGGDRPVVIVTIEWVWLCAQLLGHGVLRDTNTPISPAAARRLACDVGILPVVLGGDRQPLDLGRTQRLFTYYQRQAIATRDKHCVHPGCDRPPRWCEYHHIKHWVDGGATDITNAVLLCTYHHGLYDRDEWRITTNPETGPTHIIPPTFIDLHQQPIPIRR